MVQSSVILLLVSFLVICFFFLVQSASQFICNIVSLPTIGGSNKHCNQLKQIVNHDDDSINLYSDFFYCAGSDPNAVRGHWICLPSFVFGTDIF